MAKPYEILINTTPNNKIIIQTAVNNDIMDTVFQSAIVDNQGNEIPITQEMIQDACAALEYEANSIYDSEVVRWPKH